MIRSETPLARAATVLLVLFALALGGLAYYIARLGHPWTSYQVVICIVLSASSVAVTRLAPKRRMQVLSLGVSIALSLYIVEIVVFSLLERRRADELPSCSSQPCDRRSVRAVLRDLERQTGRRAYPVVNAMRQGITKAGLTPLSGIANTGTVFCHDGANWVTYKSDEHGFRNPSGTWARGKPPLLAVGDSFTHGMCVPQPFMEAIRDRYPGTVNLGIMGHGPLAELGVLKEYGPALRPATVLWLYYEGNDMGDLLMENRTTLERYLERGFSQRLFERQPEIDELLRTYYDKQLGSAGLLNRNRLKLSSTRVFLFDHLSVLRSVTRTEDLGDRAQTETVFAGDAASPEATEFIEVIAEAKRTVDTWGGNLVFAYLPAVYRFRDDSYDPGGKSHLFVVTAISRLGVRMVDLPAAFQRTPDPRPLFREMHYSREGNAYVAQQLLSELAK